MLLRGLGHQNDGDSLATRREREKERKGERQLLHRFRLTPSPCLSFRLFPSTLSLSDIPIARLPLSVFLTLNWRLFLVFVYLILNSVLLSLSFVLLSLRPVYSVSLSRPVSLSATSKVWFIFYYSSCLSDMFRVILRLCDPLRSMGPREIYFASSMF